MPVPLFQIDFSQKKEYKIHCDQQIIHVEEYGHPHGIPAVFFHGGPGQGFSAKKAAYFNPQKYRIILIDQRGCGKSTPKLDLKINTTQNLLKDADIIRQFLNIKHWVILGSSWGATLALLYAEAYPNQVLGLVLRGTFLAQSEEVFHDLSAAAQTQPQAWADFKSGTHQLIKKFDTQLESKDWISIYDALFKQKNFEIRQQAAGLIYNWFKHILALSLLHNIHPEALPTEDEINALTIEFHYHKNQYFLTPNQIINNINPLIRHQIPVHIIHGIKDLICSPKNADALQGCLPQHLVTRYDVIAGHLGEEVTDEATVLATEALANSLKNK